MNDRLTKKDRGLVKGAIRRVFSRSELRRSAIEKATVLWTDFARPRVTKWIKCEECKEHYPRYLAECDHKDPVIPLHLTLEDMSWDDIIGRIWCDPSNLQIVCKPCHRLKSASETKQRAQYKRSKKK